MKLIHKAMEQFFDDLADDICETEGQIGVFHLYQAFTKNISEREILSELHDYSGESKFLHYAASIHTIYTSNGDNTELN